MRQQLFLDGTHIGPYWDKPLGRGASCRDRVAEFVAGLKDCHNVYIILSTDAASYLDGVSSTVPDGWELLIIEDLDTHAVLSEMASRSQSDVLSLYAPADAPFLDAVLADRIIQLHVEYAAEYTFADGYPQGLAVEVLSHRAFSGLSARAADVAGFDSRRLLFSVAETDINSFDIDTYISPVDARMMRAAFYADTRRRFVACDRLAGKLPDLSGVAVSGADACMADRIAQEVVTNPGFLRTTPAFVQIEITTRTRQRPVYLPYDLLGDLWPGARAPNGAQEGTAAPSIAEPAEGFDMPLDSVGSLLAQLEELESDLVICPSQFGEPSFHPQFEDIARLILAHPDRRLLVETSGIGWEREMLQRVDQIAPERIEWVVCLDSQNPQAYRRIRGDGLQEAMACVEQLIELAGERVYVQATRLSGYEKELEEMYRFWKERGDRLIIQKHNDYNGRIESRKVSDLSPVQRFACWHLRRDIVIRQDGTYAMCAQDLDGREGPGHTLSDGASVSALWDAQSRKFTEHAQGTYEGLCANCDEYYTFNF